MIFDGLCDVLELFISSYEECDLRKELAKQSLKTKWFFDSMEDIGDDCPYCIHQRKYDRYCVCPEIICCGCQLGSDDKDVYIDYLCKIHNPDLDNTILVCDLNKEALGLMIKAFEEVVETGKVSGETTKLMQDKIDSLYG